MWAALAVSGALPAATPVRLQLKWHHQFQFAGYYAAQAQGYYEQAGLDVEITTGTPTRSPLPEVLAGRADFGVSDTDVLVARLRGEPLVVCAAIFQHSPYVLLSRADRGIRSPHDLVGKRVMLAGDQGAAQLRAMLALEGISPGLIQLVPHSWDLQDLVSGKVDAVSAYATVEPFQLGRMGVEPAILRTLDYGVDFYGDALFSTDDYLRKNRSTAEAFVRSSLQGWNYAMAHPEQVADLILGLPGVKERGTTRAQLLAEADAMRQLVLPSVVEIGHMNPGRWGQIAETYVAQGIVPGDSSLDGFIYDPVMRIDRTVWRRLAVGAGAVGLIVVLVLNWNLQIRRQVRRRTEELRAEVDRRTRAEEEQRALADRLEVERARLAAAQAIAKLGHWESNLVSGQVWWSSETHRIFETNEQVYQPTDEEYLEFVHPEDRALVDAAFRESLHQREPRVGEHRLVVGNGGIKYVEQRWQTVFADDGSPARMVGTCQDITDRRLAEEQLRLLENCVARLSDAVVIARVMPPGEPGPEILFVNEAFESITGYTPADALGQSPRFLYSPHASRDTLDTMRANLVLGRASCIDVLGRTKAGRDYWVELNTSPVADETGRLTHMVAIVRDITERRRLEEQFLRAQRMESIGTLAGGIAHDLNNLLVPVIMGVDIIRRRDPTEANRNVLQNIERSAKRAAGLVKQVLSFARGVDGARVAVHLRHIFDEIEGIVSNTFPKNIGFTCYVNPDLWLVEGDPTQLNQVLLNLCVNARDAMPEGGHLKLTATNVTLDRQCSPLDREIVAGDYVMLTVEDSGSGMSDEVKDRVFEPFFTTKAIGEGSGLGLSTALGIVRSHGGAVTVDSGPGRGSRFIVYLPANASGAAAASTGIEHGVMPRGNGELILLVDDEGDIRNVAMQMLQLFDYRTISAENGMQALELFAANAAEIKLVLTDLMMPVMDGMSLIQELRRRSPHLPIVAASGLHDRSKMDQLLENGVSQFLAKPFTPDLLLHAVRDAMAESAGPT